MLFNIDDIYVKNKILVNGNAIEVLQNTINVITGKNGVGKTLILQRMFEFAMENDIKAVYVEQSNDAVVKSCSVLENISMSKEKEAISEAFEYLKRYNLEYLAEHEVNELSGGEKRLVCLLRGFFHATELLLVDEPTNDLDYRMVEIIKKIFWDLRENHTVIMVSHDDRMKNIADCLVEISKKHIRYEKARSEEKKKCTSLHENKYDISMLYKIVKKDVISKIIVVLMVIMAIYTLFIYKHAMPMQVAPITDGEIDIFIPISSCGGSVVTEGAIPISAISCLDDTLSMKERVSKLSDAVTYSSKLEINYGLEINDSSKYDVFELEYYSPQIAEYFYPLDYYKKECNIEENLAINTSQYFIGYEAGTDVSSHEFSVEEFEQYKNNMLNECEIKMECTFLVVSLKDDMDFYTFITSKEMEGLLGGNYYIRSNETIELINQARAFTGKKNSISFILCVGSILMILEVLAFFITIYVNRKVFIVFKNIGVHKKQILEMVKKKYCDGKYRILLLCVALGIEGIILIKNGGFELIGAYINIMALALLLFITYKIKGVIIKRYINYICSWRYR